MKKKSEKKSVNKKNKKDLKNLTRWMIIILILVLTIYFAYIGLFAKIAEETIKLGLFGIFIVGIIFGYSFAAFPASIIFIYLAGSYNPFVIAFIGALGTLFEETTMFVFFNKGLPKEINKLGKNLEKFVNIFRFKGRLFKLFITLIAAIIFMTPIPNEVGIYLMSLEHINPKLFMLLSFTTSFIAILLLALLGHSLF